jgi:hypothetical protein
VLSRKVGKDAVLEVLVLARVEEGVGNSLLPLSTAAAGTSNS